MFMSSCNILQFVFPTKSQKIDHIAHHFLKKWNAHIENEVVINGHRQEMAHTTEQKWEALGSH